MKKKSCFLATISLLLSFYCFSQTPNWAWAKSAGGLDHERAYGTTTDSSGNVYVTGSFLSSSMNFGSTTLNNLNPGYEDLFLTKYDRNGNLLWTKSAGGMFRDFAYSIVHDGNGFIYLTGTFQGPSISFDTITLAHNGGIDQDFFLVKYDENGNVIWANGGGGMNSEISNSIATDNNGNVLIAGYFNSPSLSIGSFTLTTNGDCDIFVLKYNNNGNLIWAKSAGGSTNDYNFSTASDNNGNIFITGSFQSPTLTFGSTTLTNPNMGNGTGDVFIAKYDSNGNVTWAKSAGGIAYNDYSQSIITDINDNVYISGYFGSTTISFDTFSLVNSSSSSFDIFLVKYDNNGNVIWAQSAFGMLNDYGWSLANDNSGNIYLGGFFSGPDITFGSHTVTNTYPFTEDIFVVKYDSSGNAQWATGDGELGNDEVYGIATNGNGEVYAVGTFTDSSFILGNYALSNMSTSGKRDIFIAKLSGSTNINDDTTKKTEAPFIYSNLTNDNLVILRTEKVKEINIFDRLGKKIYSLRVNNQPQLNLNVSKFINGLYFIEAVMSQSRMQYKFVRQ